MWLLRFERIFHIDYEKDFNTFYFKIKILYYKVLAKTKLILIQKDSILFPTSVSLIIFDFKLNLISRLNLLSFQKKCTFKVSGSFSNIKIKATRVSILSIKKEIFHILKYIIFYQIKECCQILLNTFINNIFILSHTKKLDSYFQKNFISKAF